MRLAIKQTFFYSGIIVCASFGFVIGSWTLRGQYPVSEKRRVVLTPVVAPGEALEIAREVDRRDNCEISVRGYVEYSNGKRIPISQRFEPGFGPLGFDAYIMEIGTSPTAPSGPAYAWTKPGSACNPIEYLFNLLTPGQEKIDRFIVAPETVRLPVPPEMKIRRPAQSKFDSMDNRPGTDENDRHIPPR